MNYKLYKVQYYLNFYTESGTDFLAPLAFGKLLDYIYDNDGNTNTKPNERAVKRLLGSVGANKFIGVLDGLKDVRNALVHNESKENVDSAITDLKDAVRSCELVTFKLGLFSLVPELNIDYDKLFSRLLSLADDNLVVLGEMVECEEGHFAFKTNTDLKFKCKNE